MKGLVLFLLVWTMPSAFASSSALHVWNEQAFRSAFATRLTSFPEVSNVVATLNVAMFEAANAIERRYEPYLYRDPVPLNANAQAAVHAAAYAVLVARFPSQASLLVNTYNVEIGKLADDVRKADGIRVGNQAARAILLSRPAELRSRPQNWAPRTPAGAYVPTTDVVAPELGRSTPWLLARADQFRPRPPPPLDSEAYKEALREVAVIGRATTPRRTQNQTDAALFWAMSGVHAWNRALVQSLAQSPSNAVDALRMGALLNMALADSYIAAWEAKYHYSLWRPVTAIRRQIQSGETTEATWQPLLETPLHPEYPSGHSVNAGVGLSIIQSLLPNLPGRTLIISSEDPNGPKRSFQSAQAMADEISDARVWAGIHFRFSCDEGREMGALIAKFAIKSVLSPRNGRPSD